MAEKKKAKSRDRHASGHMIRLDDESYEQLKRLAQASRRPMTTELRIALEKYVAASKRQQ